MELHTAQSTEKEAMLSMSWLSRNSSLDDPTAKRINQSEDAGTEGSASPKSYDSRSSVEDKVTQCIRQLPIPKTLKVQERIKSSETYSGSEESAAPSLRSTYSEHGYSPRISLCHSEVHSVLLYNMDGFCSTICLTHPV